MDQFEFIYGFHTVNSVLTAEPNLISEIFILANRTDERLNKLIQIATKERIKLHRVSRHELDHLVGSNAQHQGIIAKCRSVSGFSESVLKKLIEETDHAAKLFLVLDGVQDPHNLGACLRSANAFGVNAVIAPKDRASGLTPVARKVASGAASVTPFIQVTNLARTLKMMQDAGIWIVGTVAETQTQIWEIDLKSDIAIVMGNEGQGMRKLTQQHCDYLASIPSQGTVESLNVSAATAVCLYEVLRQRKSKN